MSLSRRILLLALPALPAACASADVSYYRLSAVPGPARPGAPAVVELRRIDLARYLDRAEILRANGPNRLELLPDVRWAEPLGEMIERVLAENLGARLPGSTVSGEGGALRPESDTAAEVEIRRFEADATQVMLLAQVATRRGTRPRAAQTVELQVPVRGSDTTALVAAMSQAIGQLADRLAGMLSER